MEEHRESQTCKYMEIVETEKSYDHFPNGPSDESPQRLGRDGTHGSQLIESIHTQVASAFSGSGSSQT
jgi:hypothetical protein